MHLFLTRNITWTVQQRKNWKKVTESFKITNPDNLSLYKDNSSE